MKQNMNNMETKNSLKQFLSQRGMKIKTADV